jgi:hypothetical protein
MSSGVQSCVGGVVVLGSDGGVGFDVCWVGERGRVFLGVKHSASFISSGLSPNTQMVSRAFRDPVVIGRAVVSRVRSVGWFLAPRMLIDLDPYMVSRRVVFSYVGFYKALRSLNSPFWVLLEVGLWCFGA